MKDSYIAASCLLSALDREDPEQEAEYTRCYVGAVLMAEAIIAIITSPKG